MNKLTLNTQIEFKAPSTEVWKGLTDTEIAKQYFFGTEQQSEYKVDSPITWKGEWDGKSYEDKGVIKEIEPGKHLKYTYWSSMSGTEDKPENYANVTYDLVEDGSITTLTITQDNVKDEASKEHSENNWKMMFDGLKKLIEK